MDELLATYQSMPWFCELLDAVQEPERMAMEEPWLRWLLFGPPPDSVGLACRGDGMVLRGHYTGREEEEKAGVSSEGAKLQVEGEGPLIPWTRMRESAEGCKEVVGGDGCCTYVTVLGEDAASDDVITAVKFEEMMSLLQVTS
jgi:hypothetical protein